MNPLIPQDQMIRAAKLQQQAAEVRAEITKALKENDAVVLKKYGREREVIEASEGISPDEMWKRHLARTVRAMEQKHA